MLRSGEGQSIGESVDRGLNSPDAFSHAIIAEKDPFARGYMENLRAQIAAIAAKHGANARDVWDPAVQARMSVDEMDAVNDLFARIKAMAERKMSRGEERRILADVEKLEDEARAMVEAVQKDELALEIVEAYLSEGLVHDVGLSAMRFFSKGENPIPPDLNVRLELARAAHIAKMDKGSKWPLKNAKRICLQAAMYVRGEHSPANHPISSLECNRLFLAAYDAYLSFLTNEEVDSEMDNELTDSASWPGPYRRVAVERLAAEARARGLFEPTKFIVAIESVEEDEAPDEKIEDFLREQLVVAEMLHRRGLDPEPAIARVGAAYRKAVTVLIDPMDPQAVPRNVLRDEIVRTIGKIDRRDLLEMGIGSAELERAGEAIPVPLICGYIDAGAFDKAEELLARQTDWITQSVCGQVFVAKLLEAGNIAMAQRIHDDYASGSQGVQSEILRAKLAERARRGENVLDEVRGGDDRTIVKAVIATIGYTVGMRKRIAEYAAKR